MSRILDEINFPSDMKSLSNEELLKLCTEIREQMIIRLSNTGGHVGSNLGVIEATVALHYVFNSPIDKIVFDVSHQSYTHKLLTGRKEAYMNPEKYSSVSGFTNPLESEHDIFSIGHTSTSISLACGLAKARDLKEEKNNIIAVVGDGALSGGEALEGLNNASVLQSNIIIIINDNDMSIAENHGGLYQNLKALRESNGQSNCNLFKALGFDYYLVRDGNNLEDLIETFKKVKDIDHPVIVHMCTVKGKGYLLAEQNKEKWHFQGAFNLGTGNSLQVVNETEETYENLTRDYLTQRMKEDKNVIAITAGTPKVLGFDEKTRQEFKEQFVDVGIAEEHAVAFASGIAKNGGKPVFGVSSSFIQRTYDQLSQDLALNNSPAVILVFFNGITSESQTHLGVFDIPLISNIPNIVYLAPTCKEEYISMLDWSLNQTNHPVVIRVPGIIAETRNSKILNDYDKLNKYEVVEKGNKVAILGLGKFFKLGTKVKDLLKEKANIKATLINPRYITGIDNEVLEKLKEDHELVITLEDGVIDGGFGEKIARFYSNSNIKVLNFGAKKEFVNNVKLEELYEKYHLREDMIVSDILGIL
ncbi:MAG: 1-deoxy-D-xylulose-5-phosphate synthase [Clostridia bacterium]|nr:1-deoxy-D-xylulose-5-phosphate synthase [Clostridia bacterium]